MCFDPFRLDSRASINKIFVKSQDFDAMQASDLITPEVIFEFFDKMGLKSLCQNNVHDSLVQYGNLVESLPKYSKANDKQYLLLNHYFDILKGIITKLFCSKLPNDDIWRKQFLIHVRGHKNIYISGGFVEYMFVSKILSMLNCYLNDIGLDIRLRKNEYSTIGGLVGLSRLTKPGKYSVCLDFGHTNVKIGLVHRTNKRIQLTVHDRVKTKQNPMTNTNDFISYLIHLISKAIINSNLKAHQISSINISVSNYVNSNQSEKRGLYYFLHNDDCALKSKLEVSLKQFLPSFSSFNLLHDGVAHALSCCDENDLCITWGTYFGIGFFEQDWFQGLGSKSKVKVDKK